MIVASGDILCTRSGGWAAASIRLGAALLGKPNTINHVAIVSHKDKAGTWWGIEGRPGGVGWRDLSVYLNSSWTLNNAKQGKQPTQRQAVAETARQLLGTPYDWRGIMLDAMDAAHIGDLWKRHDPKGVPGHLVCSALAAYTYDRVGLHRPVDHDVRETTPGDWAAFCITHQFNAE